MTLRDMKDILELIPDEHLDDELLLAHPGESHNVQCIWKPADFTELGRTRKSNITGWYIHDKTQIMKVGRQGRHES